MPYLGNVSFEWRSRYQHGAQDPSGRDVQGWPRGALGSSRRRAPITPLEGPHTPRGRRCCAPPRAKQLVIFFPAPWRAPSSPPRGLSTDDGDDELTDLQHRRYGCPDVHADLAAARRRIARTGARLVRECLSAGRIGTLEVRFVRAWGRCFVNRKYCTSIILSSTESA